MDRAGLVGQDGPTHHGLFDIAYLRTFPNFTIAAPRDATDMRRMLELALTESGPLALRYPRDNTPGSERIHANERTAMVPGKAEVLVEAPAGERAVCLWAFGALVNQALDASERLARRGIAVTVVDARFAKPLDEELLAQHALAYRHILTPEEHQPAGGFGSAVPESRSRPPSARAPVRVPRIPPRFHKPIPQPAEPARARGAAAGTGPRRQWVGPCGCAVSGLWDAKDTRLPKGLAAQLLLSPADMAVQTLITPVLRWPTQGELHNPPRPWRPLPPCFATASAQEPSLPDSAPPLFIVPSQKPLDPPSDRSRPH